MLCNLGETQHTSDGQLLKNFHNELSHPILRILIGSKEIESESSLWKFIVKVHSTSRMWKFIVKVLGRFLLQNFHNELSLPIFRFPATFYTYKPSINLSNYSQNANDHNHNYNPMPRTTHKPINQRPLQQQLHNCTYNYNTMPGLSPRNGKVGRLYAK